MPELIHRYDDPAWLPAGGMAEVWRATSPDVPEPVCVARLLARDGHGRIAVVERSDGGLDIPSATAGDRNLSAVLDALLTSVPRASAPPQLLGWVRNVVPSGSADYPWPAPYAHFVVWTTQVEAPGAGDWLDVASASLALGARHWWPLVAPPTWRT